MVAAPHRYVLAVHVHVPAKCVAEVRVQRKLGNTHNAAANRRGIDSPAAAPYRPLPYPRHSACCDLGGEVLVLVVVVVCPQSSSHGGSCVRERDERLGVLAQRQAYVRAASARGPLSLPAGSWVGSREDLGPISCNMYLPHHRDLSSTGRIGLRSPTGTVARDRTRGEVNARSATAQGLAGVF